MRQASPVFGTDLLFQTGLAWHRQGQWEQAKTCYLKVLDLNSKHFDSLHFLGILAYHSKHFDEAIEYLEKAISTQPYAPEPHSNLGLTLLETGQYESAISAYGEAIRLHPDFAEAYYNRGNVFQLLGKHLQACADYDQALKIRPVYAVAYYNRGISLHALWRLAEALASYDQAIVYAPHFAAAHSNRAFVLLDLSRPQDALASCTQALALEPNYAQALSNQGQALLALNRAQEAVASLQRAIQLQPDLAQAHFNLGNAWHALAKPESAVACFEQATRIKPEFALAHWNQSLSHLLLGDYPSGWPLYEWRWKKQDTAHLQRHFAQPLWLGQSDLRGQTILLHAEQGLGDTLQFCRFTPMVKALGARVVLEAHPSLLGLLSTLEGVDALVPQDQALPDFDCHCPLLSLPLALRIDLQHLPAPRTYLSASAPLVEKWRNRLGSTSKPRIGIVWSSTSGFQNDVQRSLTLAQIMQCLDPDRFELIVLQKEIKEADRTTFDSLVPQLRFFEGELTDFAQTAALAQCMDLVISTCTSVPHMTAALGLPTWVLLAHVPDWRWLLERKDSPWYPSVRLYRQKSPGAWGAPLSDIQRDLAVFSPA